MIFDDVVSAVMLELTRHGALSDLMPSVGISHLLWIVTPYIL